MRGNSIFNLLWLSERRRGAAAVAETTTTTTTTTAVCLSIIVSPLLLAVGNEQASRLSRILLKETTSR